MKKILLSVLIGSFLFSACRKQALTTTPVACSVQTINPNTRSYTSDSFVAVSNSGKHCGMMPLSRGNYWIYQDSVFNYGTFVKVQYDTLQFEKTFQTLSDKLIWWQSNIQIGLPTILYASDSGIFSMSQRMFSSENIWDASTEYSLFPGESANYLAHFDDNAAQGKSSKLETPVNTPSGVYNDCIQYEKYARSYRRDETFFKPGLGVIRYTYEEAPMGSPTIKLMQVSTLVAFHLE